MIIVSIISNLVLLAVLIYTIKKKDITLIVMVASAILVFNLIQPIKDERFLIPKKDISVLADSGSLLITYNGKILKFIGTKEQFLSPKLEVYYIGQRSVFDIVTGQKLEIVVKK